MMSSIWKNTKKNTAVFGVKLLADICGEVCVWLARAKYDPKYFNKYVRDTACSSALSPTGLAVLSQGLGYNCFPSELLLPDFRKVPWGQKIVMECSNVAPFLLLLYLCRCHPLGNLAWIKRHFAFKIYYVFWSLDCVVTSDDKRRSDFQKRNLPMGKVQRHVCYKYLYLEGK